MKEIFLSAQVAFGLGLIAQMCIRILGKRDASWPVWKFIALFPTALVFAFLFYEKEGPIHPENFFLFFALWVVAVGCIFFRTYIVPKVNELSLLVWNAAVFYLAFVFFQFSALLIIPLMSTLISFFLAVFDVKLPRWAQIGSMIWFFLLGVYLTIGLFPWSIVLKVQPQDPATFWQMFFLGSIVCYSFTCIVYLGYFVHLPSKNHSPSLKEQREYGDLIESKFDETQFHPYATVAIFLLLITVFVGNYHFGWVKNEFLLSFVLTFSPWLGEGVHKMLLV